ncbi:MAG: exodeoxyribonuclease III [Deltaproteobacteria bacterium]|nr:exodeoxyribonuclease III [Deltaproteobacteria bacterium]MBW1928541.1 exodeoxyribonuclease III [Deltaproteobacteria bacterium]MBW2026093.1 exodeoxyribonuclease III [Deltaproteobacteria bacterium]MBW2124586.1 exodeoxyribonuclease III [Deltaproteobacteria bacterium]RLB22670.1 MAG: exodeoxyribonuclease III [Deltaproteobacteria bacterium]
MIFATYNCNSIRARLPIIKDWLTQNSLDILCLQETKVQDRDFPAKEIQALGYHVAYKGQKAYNGVAILSKERPRDIRSFLETDEEDARFLRATIRQIPILNVYVPQGVSPDSDKFAYKLQWLRRLLTYLDSHFSPDDSLLVAGDFNVALEPRDVYDPEGLQGEVGFHPKEQEAMRELLGWGLQDLFRKHESRGGFYTFWDYRIPNALKRKMGWRIDYVLATAPLADKCVRVWIDEGARSLKKPSDHTFLVAEFDLV